MMASMFAGARNVNISGGNFRTINGPYNHNEFITNNNNVDSNNIYGNTYTDEHNDNSQTNYGRAKTRNGRNRCTTAAPSAPRVQQQDERRQAYEPYTLPQASFPARSYTTPARRSSNLSSAFNIPAMTQVGPGTFMNIKQGDVQDFKPEAAAHFEKFFAAQFSQSDGDEPNHELDEDSVMQFQNEDDDGTDEDDAEEVSRMRCQSPPTARMAGLSLGNPLLYSPQPRSPAPEISRMRSQSPPTARMAHLSLGNPSLYSTQPPVQAPEYTPYLPPYTPAAAARNSVSGRPAPPLPAFQAQQNQDQSYTMPPLSNPNLSRQATQSHMNYVRSTLISSGNMNPNGQSFVDAPHTYSSTIYDSTDPSAIIPVSVVSDADTNARSGPDSSYRSFNGVGVPPGLGQIFNGTFTEFSHTVNTTNHGLSGVIANNVVRNVRGGRHGDGDGLEDEQEGAELECNKKRPGTTGNQGRVPPRRR